MFIDNNGYERHPSWKREHRLIMGFELGYLETYFPSFKWVVHHIDGDKSNNHPDNLEVMPMAKHTRLHMVGKSRNGIGKYRGTYYAMKKAKDASTKVWQTQICYNNHTTSLGNFNDFISGEIVYDFVRGEIHD